MTTPTPWGVFSAILEGKVAAEQLFIQPADGAHDHPDDFSDIIAEIPWQHFNVDERTANAELIVRAVNAHEALLTAAKAAEAAMNYMGDILNANDMATKEGLAVCSPAFAQLRAAISLAEGPA